MALWQRGEALTTHCNTWLDGAEAKLATGSEARPPDRKPA
jgi:exonuclease VII small subunit